MTRIIAGNWRSRKLEVPKGRDVRPTTDRMRERLFSMLSKSGYPNIEGARVADLFAGTGALGLEALSRGANICWFVEKAPASLNCLKENISTLKAEDVSRVIRGSAERLPSADEPFDIIFMDPPYRQGLVEKSLNSIKAQGWTHENSLIVAELASDENFTVPEGFTIIDDRSQGQQRILFLGVSTVG